MIMCAPITYVDMETNETFKQSDEVKIIFFEYAKDRYDELVLIGSIGYLYEDYFILFSEYAYKVYIEDIKTMEKV